MNNGELIKSLDSKHTGFITGIQRT